MALYSRRPRSERSHVITLQKRLEGDVGGSGPRVGSCAGLEEVYCVLDAIREAYERCKAPKDIAFLVKRVRGDVESAVDAGLAGFNGVVLDTMRDVMEVEYLLMDFLHDNQQIRKLFSMCCYMTLIP